MNIRPVLIMAGGTGGHIFPALSLAVELRRQGKIVHWLGSKKGLEIEIVRSNGFILHCISSYGVRGKPLIQKLISPIFIFWSLLETIFLFFRFRPTLCVGFGGYSSASGGLIASVFRIPLIIHEQNSVPGLTNRILSRFADRIAIGFPCSLQDAVFTGNPVRNEIIKVGEERLKRVYTNTENKIHILILGGSQGARIFNQSLPDLLMRVSKESKMRITHQTGENNNSELIAKYKELGIEARILQFINNIAHAYFEADLIICRAGALTVSEVAASALPAIFIPYPFAVDDHQTTNAKYLVDVGAAQILPQKDLSELPKQIQQILKAPKKLKAMSLSAKKMAHPEALKKLVALVLDIKYG